MKFVTSFIKGTLLALCCIGIAVVWHRTPCWGRQTYGDKLKKRADAAFPVASCSSSILFDVCLSANVKIQSL